MDFTSRELALLIGVLRSDIIEKAEALMTMVKNVSDFAHDGDLIKARNMMSDITGDANTLKDVCALACRFWSLQIQSRSSC